MVGYENCGEESGARKALVPENKSAVSEIRELKIFPNPATDKLSLQSKKESESYVVTIRDVTGRILLCQNVRTKFFVASLDLNLINGIYFVTVSNDNNEKVTKKLIIGK